MRASFVTVIVRLCLAGMVIAIGCTTTTFTSTWLNPGTQSVSLEGRKIIALVVSTDETTRRAGEDTIAAQITARGAQGVPAWTILPTTDARNEEKAMSAIASVGAAAVVTMEILFQTREFTPLSFPLRSRPSASRAFWAHYRWTWEKASNPGPPPSTTVWMETLVHTLDPEVPIWGGQSRTVRANQTSALFAEVSRATARELECAGLIRPSGWRRVIRCIG
jgi:hypothetical protein